MSHRLICENCQNEELFSQIKLFVSELCGHTLCTICIDKFVNLKKEIVCPICKTEGNRDNWEGSSFENKMNEETIVRNRIQSIYNKSRGAFQDTPGYNNYLENIEDMIYQLCYNPRDDTRKKILFEVESYEVEHQKEILENKKIKEKQYIEWVRDIVRREGIFYQIVKKNYMDKGFKYTNNNELSHTLQQMHPAFFNYDEDEKIKTYGAPRPIDQNIDSNNLPKVQATDRHALLRAGGYTKTAVWERLTLEFKLCFDV